MPPRMALTSTEADQAVTALEGVHPWGESTARRERTVRALLTKWYRLQKGAPAAVFMGLVQKNYAPTTVLGLLVTAQRMFPNIRNTYKWKELLLWLKQKAATHQTHQAKPATITEVSRMRDQLPRPLATMTTMLFLTASRYADVQHMNLRKVWKTPSGNLIIRLDLPMWKSDRFGKRFFSKTMDIPRFLSIQEIWAMLQCPPKYWTLLQAIKQISPHLSVHSLRRRQSQLDGTETPVPVKENEASLREQMTVNVSQDLYSLPKTLLDLWSSTEDLEVPVEFSIVRGSSDTAALMFFVDGKRKVIRSPRGKCFLPLAPIAAPDFNFDALRQLFTEVSPPDDMSLVVSMFTTDIIANFVTEHPDFEASCKNTSLSKVVSREPAIFNALDTLICQGTLSKTHSSKCAFVLPVFTVPKHDGVSSRLIIDCRPINDILRDFPMPRMPLPELGVLIGKALRHSYMAARDAASMFYQFALHPSLAALLQIRVGGHRGAFRSLQVNVLPMGITIAPSCAQIISNYIAAVLMHRLHNTVEVVCWVDNFIFFGDSPEDVQRALSAFDVLCSDLQFVIKEDHTKPSTSLVALGLLFDLSSKEVSPSTEAQAAIHKALQNASKAPTGWTFLSWFGHVSWLNFAVGQKPMACFRTIMDTAREVARNPLTRPTEKEQWYNSALSLTDELCAAKRKSGMQPPTYPNVILWSDASTIGLGAVFEGPLETQVISAPMAGITPQRMCTAELLAGLTGALHFREKLKSNFTWAVGNTAACRALARGHSGSKSADSIILEWIRSAPLPQQMLVVPSQCQLADEPSRACHLTRKRCGHAVTGKLAFWGSIYFELFVGNRDCFV